MNNARTPQPKYISLSDRYIDSQWPNKPYFEWDSGCMSAAASLYVLVVRLILYYMPNTSFREFQ